MFTTAKLDLKGTHHLDGSNPPIFLKADTVAFLNRHNIPLEETSLRKILWETAITLKWVDTDPSPFCRLHLPNGTTVNKVKCVNNLRELERLLTRDLTQSGDRQGSIPNARKYTITQLSDYHPIFLEAGIEKRQFEPIKEVEGYSNKELNRYIRYQFWRAKQYLKNGSPGNYWRHLNPLRNSDAIRILAFHRVFPGWHRNMSLKSLKGIIRRNLRLTSDSEYRYWKVGIAKANGETRWLGVPGKEWRIELFILNSILQEYNERFDHPHQHGFIRQRGTHTAWKQIHTEVLNHRYIYEFDLRKFFDSINLDYLRHTLHEMGYPPHIIQEIDKINRTMPYDPSTGKKTLKHDLTWPDKESEYEDKWYHYYGHYPGEQSIRHHALGQWEGRDSLGTLPEHPDLNHPYCYYHGVSQGSPLSPTLSNIIVNKLLLNRQTSTVKIVQYADDGIIYSNEPFNPSDILKFPRISGIEHHPTKSKWIRRNDWESPLKFLGLKYYPNSLLPTEDRPEGLLTTDTRTPKEYSFRLEGLIMRAAEYDEVYENHTTETRRESNLLVPNKIPRLGDVPSIPRKWQSWQTQTKLHDHVRWRKLNSERDLLTRNRTTRKHIPHMNICRRRTRKNHDL